MANGAGPGVGAYSGAGNVMNEQEFYATSGMGGQFGFPPTGADQLVYLGKMYEAPRGPAAPGITAGSARYGEQGRRETAMVPIDVAKKRVGFFSDAEKERISKAAARYYGNAYAGATPSYWASLWGDAIDATAVMSKETGRNLSVWDTLEQMADRKAALDAESAAGGGGAYTGPVTTVRLTDPDTAMTLVDQSLQAALGRGASQQEKNRFLKALREYEMANPTVTTGDQTGSVTTGGSNAQVFAQRFGAAQEGAAEFETATTFLDAFLGALGNPVQ